MVTIDIKLKPCPFCGFAARTHKDYYGYVVQCTNCRITTVHEKNKWDAIELWNHRTEVPDND